MSAKLFETDDQQTTLVVRYSREMQAKYGLRLLYIGRWNRYYELGESPWHNPFSVRQYGTKALALYFQYLLERPGLFNLIPTLRGRVLACWCKPGKCHGDALALVANALPEYAQMSIILGPDDLCNFCFQRLTVAHHSESCAYFVNAEKLWATL